MHKYLVCCIGFWLMVSCSPQRKAASRKDDGRIDINFIQVNDVYEIAPLSGGREGGVARIATLKKKYSAKNPNSFLVMAGDFLSPSIYQSLQYEGRPVRGKQMVEALNAAGLDFAVFGNHEFDIRENELLDRMKESDFRWIATNSFHRIGNKLSAFANATETYILHVRDADGTTASIGLLGICLPFNRADYVGYTDPLSSAKKAFAQLQDSVDAVIAITHQAIEDDALLAKEIPGLAAIIGGHEHDQRFRMVGKTPITKSMANAKSAYVIQLAINKKKKTNKVDYQLEVIDERWHADSTTDAVVKKWTGIADKNFSALGFDAQKIVLRNSAPLDGREAVIRSQPTNLGKLIVAGMSAAAPAASVVLMNSGSIRVDDVLQMPLTEYDILRTLPFGGVISEVDMTGRLLVKVLDQGRKNSGNGGYLVYNNELTTGKEGQWLLNGAPIDAQSIYHVALAEFLLTGKEANLEFLHPGNPEIKKVYEAITSRADPRSDIRKALIQYLEKK